MGILSQFFRGAAAAVVLTIGGVGAASAVTLSFDSSSVSTNSPATGASGTASFAFSDAGAGLLNVVLTLSNTTGTIPSFGAGATTSSMRGIGFDLFGGANYKANSLATGTDLTNSGTGVTLNNLNATLDLAFFTGANFNGGGSANGIIQGATGTISFILENSALNAAAYEAAFLAALPTATGKNAVNDFEAVMRFQEVNAGAGSDFLLYVNGGPTPIPLPASGLLFLVGFGGLAVMRRFKKA